MKLSERTGWIYFIHCSPGFIKIGFSINPVQRQQTLINQTDTTIYPPNIRMVTAECLGIVKGTYALEKELHRMFAAYRTTGEWFVATEEMLLLLRSINKTPLCLPAPSERRQHAPKHKSDEQSPLPTYLTPNEAAKIMKVSRQTIYNHVRSGQLASVKFGRGWRVRREDVVK